MEKLLPSKTIGRPTDITPDKVTKLVTAFQRGQSVTVALQYARVTPRAYYYQLKVDEDFCNTIEDAKDYWGLLAGDHVANLMTDRSNKNIRLKVETAKWILEKHQPELYGRQLPEGTTLNQNNYTFVSGSELKKRAESAGVSRLDPTEVIAALKRKHMAGGATEGNIVGIHSDEFSDKDTPQGDLPQPPEPV